MSRCKDCYHFKVCMDYTHLKESEFAQNYDCTEAHCEHFVSAADVAPRNDVAREIFADLEAKAPWFCENQTAYEHFIEELAELKKKYIGGVNDEKSDCNV